MVNMGGQGGILELCWSAPKMGGRSASMSPCPMSISVFWVKKWVNGVASLQGLQECYIYGAKYLCKNKKQSKQKHC